MSDFKEYAIGTKVRIKVSGYYGEAFESLYGYISVLLENPKRCEYYKLDEIEFLDD